MLDRKVKDIEASVELLKDRIKGHDTSCKTIILTGTIVMVISLVFSWYDAIDSILLMILGAALMLVALHSHALNKQRHLLLYFKTKGDKL